jgi:hypothetical protein
MHSLLKMPMVFIYFSEYTKNTEHMFVKTEQKMNGGVLMLDLRVLLMKVVKKTARELSFVGFAEKQGDIFIHTMISDELRNKLNIKSESVVRKTISQIYPEDVAIERLKLYERAWSGEEVLYTMSHADHVFFGVISPISLNGEVVRIMGSYVPVIYIPEQLRGIA